MNKNLKKKRRELNEAISEYRCIIDYDDKREARSLRKEIQSLKAEKVALKNKNSRRLTADESLFFSMFADDCCGITNKKGEACKI